MQKHAILPLLTIATSYFNAAAAIPTTSTPQIPPCLVDCFATHYAQLENCQDPTYMSCSFPFSDTILILY